MSTDHITPQSRSAAKLDAAPRRRRPLQRAAASSITALDTPAAGSTCPVAALAAQAATALRAKNIFAKPHPDYDADLIEALRASEADVPPDEILSFLYDRVYALAEFAGHIRAKSVKGALFQLYVAAGAAAYPEGRIAATLNAKDSRVLRENDCKVGRLHHSAMAFLETVAMDDDLPLLRAWFYNSSYDVHDACDQILIDRPGIIARARATTTDAQT